MEDKRLFLIDGNSLLYRSYYAIQRLSTSQGFPTNAIFGFINALKKILTQERPDFLAVVFDVKGPTVRHVAFKDYKAHRKPMPDDLVVQIPVLKEILGALGIATAEYPGYEADDVLATLAARASEQKLRAIIITTDKDLLQVVDGLTAVYNPTKDVLVDEATVRDFFGVAAGQVVDVLSLWGDPSDNIPGVPGIGEKTAKSLIQEFGSLDNMLSNVSRIKNPRIREKIEQNMDLLELSRRLVTLSRDLDLELDLGRFALGEPNRKDLVRLFQSLEFTSLLGDFLKAPERQDRVYKAIFDERELQELAARIAAAKALALDTETDSASPTRARLVGISLAITPGEAFYIPLGHDYLGAPPQVPVGRALGILRQVLEDPDIKKTGQNIKYDDIVLRRAGLRLQGIEHDTMVLSYLLEPNWGKHNLEKLALTYLQTTKAPYETVVGKGKNQLTMNKVGIERVVPYACQDADLALELGGLLWGKIKERNLDRLYAEIERPLIALLAEMEIWGVRVDPSVLKAISAELESEIQGREGKIHELAGGPFNINSPRQLASILFHKLGLPATKKTKVTKGYSTSLDILEELALLHPLAREVLEFRQLAKLKSTYADALPELINPETGRIHTSYNQTVASTGRLSSSDPNLQNIPARGEWGTRFRRAFVPDKGHELLAADYSQVELRILAHLSQDPTLLETFRGDRDIHDETAASVFGESGGLTKEETRRRAKIINFSVIYGTSAFSLAKELGTSTSEAQRFIDRYFEQRPGVRDYLDRIVEEARNRGYAETLFGRQRQVPELRQADKPTQQAGRRIALNMPIQGSAADLIKVAMLRIWDDIRARKMRTRMIMQVHDELVFEVPAAERKDAEAIVQERMEHACVLKVPLKVRLGWGPNWADAK